MRRCKALAFLLICFFLIGCGLPQAANSEADLEEYRLPGTKTTDDTTAVPARKEPRQETVAMKGKRASGCRMKKAHIISIICRVPLKNMMRCMWGESFESADIKLNSPGIFS